MNDYLSASSDPRALHQEVQRLTSLTQSQASEIEDQRRKIQALENFRDEQLRDLQKQFESIKVFNVDSNNLQVRFNAEKASYESQISQLQYRVKELESQVALYIADLERVATSNNQRLNENDALIKKVQELEDFYKIGELQSQIEFYKANSFDIKQLAIRYGADKAADQSQIKQLKQMNENYKNELQKVYELMSQRKSDYDQLQQQFEKLRRELDDSSKKNRATSGVGITKERYETVTKENDQLRAANAELRSQLEFKSSLLARIKEVDNLRSQYEGLIQGLESKLGGSTQQRYY
eukprot:CAMPEP_0176423328 /NCGR_PEP_ID=MMETSP0127-20121128/10219_1 /TAXON_ID=938130 /ORGANISM="Platyophrya macrostoma, Strain WH" /LENGTH=294 /DNA_ID=CAMNT_0017804259 /DNA_START=19 /DNA_END=903 /DNA_ORIENTATION=-